MPFDSYKKEFIFRIRDSFFYEEPIDIADCDAAVYHFCKNKVNVPGFTRIETLTSVIDLTKSLDIIWGSIERKSIRQAIIKAQKMNLEIQTNKNYEEFYSLYKSFRRAKGFESHLGLDTPPIQAMRQGTLISAIIDGHLACGNLYLEDEENTILWLSASRRLFEKPEVATIISYANKLIHWEQIQMAKEKGKKMFDWGGLWSIEETKGNTQRESLNNFKMRFGGDTEMRYSYLKVYSKTYSLLSKLLNSLK